MTKRIADQDVRVLREIVRDWSYGSEALLNVLERKGLISRAEIAEEVKRLRQAAAEPLETP
jgi:hypothetical protein